MESNANANSKEPAMEDYLKHMDNAISHALPNSIQDMINALKVDIINSAQQHASLSRGASTVSQGTQATFPDPDDIKRLQDTIAEQDGTLRATINNYVQQMLVVQAEHAAEVASKDSNILYLEDQINQLDHRLADAASAPRVTAQIKVPRDDVVTDETVRSRWAALTADINNLVLTFLTHRIAWYRLNKGAKELLHSVCSHYDEAEHWNPKRADDFAEHWRIALLVGCIWRVVFDSVFNDEMGAGARDAGTHFTLMWKEMFGKFSSPTYKNNAHNIHDANRLRVMLAAHIGNMASQEHRSATRREVACGLANEFHRLIQTGTFRGGQEDLSPFLLNLVRILQTAAELNDVFMRSPAIWTAAFPRPVGVEKKINRDTMEPRAPFVTRETFPARRHGTTSSSSATAATRQAGSSDASRGQSGAAASAAGGAPRPLIMSRRRRGGWRMPYFVQSSVLGQQDHEHDDVAHLQADDGDVWVVAVITPCLVRHGNVEGHFEESFDKTVIQKASVVCLPIMDESEDEGRDGGDSDGGDSDGGDSDDSDDSGAGAGGDDADTSRDNGRNHDHHDHPMGQERPSPKDRDEERARRDREIAKDRLERRLEMDVRERVRKCPGGRAMGAQQQHDERAHTRRPQKGSGLEGSRAEHGARVPAGITRKRVSRPSQSSAAASGSEYEDEEAHPRRVLCRRREKQRKRRRSETAQLHSKEDDARDGEKRHFQDPRQDLKQHDLRQHGPRQHGPRQHVAYQHTKREAKTPAFGPTTPVINIDDD